jgi:RsiW-degrading membrane proteinase PrsW (M82 family)
MWFVPKTHGYGAVPKNWRGWAWIAAFLATELALTWFMMVVPAQSGLGPGPLGVLVWLALTGALLVWFISVCQARTEGHWRWRWGQE